MLLAMTCLAIGVLGALGYSHYLGEGKQLAELQDELSAAKTSLAKVAQDSQQAKGETDAMSAQIQQLISTKEDLKKQLDELKSAAPAAPAPPAPNPMANMVGMMKAGAAQQHQERLLLLKTRLHLTPEQEAAVTAAMDEEEKMGEEMMSKVASGGKIDPQTMAAMTRGTKTVDQTLNDILTPDQKTAYQQMQTEQKNSAQESMATSQMNQLAPLLQLTDSQKDQVYNALYQVQMNSQDPNWIKNNPVNRSDPTGFLDAQAKAKEDALSKILTPDQLATYHQQAQSQLDTQKAMMQKFMPPTAAGAPVSAPASASPSTP
jgi:hypothetical protein